MGLNPLGPCIQGKDSPILLTFYAKSAPSQALGMVDDSGESIDSTVSIMPAWCAMLMTGVAGLWFFVSFNVFPKSDYSRI